SALTTIANPTAVTRDISVRLDLPQATANALIVTLYAPDGTPVTLINRAPTAQGFGGSTVGGPAGDLILSDSATTSIQDISNPGLNQFVDINGNLPYIGLFKPDTPLSVLRGKS